MSKTHTRDGLISVEDVSPNNDGSVRVTIAENIGQRGYLASRPGAVRALARRAVNMSGPTSSCPVRWIGTHEIITVTVFPSLAEEKEN